MRLPGIGLSLKWTARVAVWITIPYLGSCVGSDSRSAVLSFLEAVQRPFDLSGRSWLGIPAPLAAHLIVSALVAAGLAWVWRPRVAGVVLGIMILAKEAVDLSIIALYEPLTWAYASGSIVDVLISIAGMYLGLWAVARARRRGDQSADSPR